MLVAGMGVRYSLLSPGRSDGCIKGIRLGASGTAQARHAKRTKPSDGLVSTRPTLNAQLQHSCERRLRQMRRTAECGFNEGNDNAADLDRLALLIQGVHRISPGITCRSALCPSPPSMLQDPNTVPNTYGRI